MRISFRRFSTLPNNKLPRISPNQSNMLGLMHSTVEFEDQRLYNFISNLNQEEMLLPQTLKGQDTSRSPAIQLNHSLSFHDYSQDKLNNFAGYGLKTVQPIKEGEEILKISTQLGLVSDIFIEEMAEERARLTAEELADNPEHEFLDTIMKESKRVSQLFFRGPDKHYELVY